MNSTFTGACRSAEDCPNDACFPRFANGGNAISDFAGYWRNRLMHGARLWPVHVIHHSDRAMTWLALIRVPPIERLVTTVVNMAALVAVGLPGWVIVVNSIVRNFYGFFIHADLPWAYGPLKYVFASPVMHRWHHVRDMTDFATIFVVRHRVWYCHAPGKNLPPPGFDDP